MGLREEYEYLKQELMVRLTDATNMCALEFPFDFKISKEEEDRYFMRGVSTRLATKKSMIILENTYKKIRLFPSKEMADTFRETMDGILSDWKKDVSDAYEFDSWRFKHDDAVSYSEYIDKLAERIKEAAEPYAKMIEKLTPEDIEKEIKAKEKFIESEKPMMGNSSGEKKEDGLF